MLARTSKCIGRAFWAPANQISNAATHAKTTALPRKPGQAAASISYQVEFAMNPSGNAAVAEQHCAAGHIDAGHRAKDHNGISLT